MKFHEPITNSQTRSKGWILSLRVNSPSWWVWLALLLSMIAGLAGHEIGVQIAMSIAVGHAIAGFLARPRLTYFPNQVRVVFATWMAASFVSTLAAPWWGLTAGTAAYVILGYCPIARMLLFLPLNRSKPLNFQRAIRIIFNPPVPGSVLKELDI